MSTNYLDYFELPSALPTISVRTDFGGAHAGAIEQVVRFAGDLAIRELPPGVRAVVVVSYEGELGGFNPDGQRAYSGSLTNFVQTGFTSVRTPGVEWMYLNSERDGREASPQQIATALAHELDHSSAEVDRQTESGIEWLLNNSPQGSAILAMGATEIANFRQGIRALTEHLIIGARMDVRLHYAPELFAPTTITFDHYAPGFLAAVNHFVAAGSWAGFSHPSVGTDDFPFDAMDSENAEFTVLESFSNGGIAAIRDADGLIATAADGSRYTDSMLEHYGVITTRSDSTLEVRTTFGGTFRMFGDWLGLDGQFGIQGSFAQPSEGLGGSTPDDSDNDDNNNDRDDRVIVVYGGTADSNKTVITNGGPKVKPILLDLDGDGIEITELDRSTTFMDASGSGLKHRTAWAGKRDGVLFWDADNDGLISDDREYIFTEWDPTAGDDLAALRSRFDTNGDGKLNGTELAGFKLMVTNADGSQTTQTLTALGISEQVMSAETHRFRVAERPARTPRKSRSLVSADTLPFVQSEPSFGVIVK